MSITVGQFVEIRAWKLEKIYKYVYKNKMETFILLYKKLPHLTSARHLKGLDLM